MALPYFKKRAAKSGGSLCMMLPLVLLIFFSCLRISLDASRTSNAEQPFLSLSQDTRNTTLTTRGSIDSEDNTSTPKNLLQFWNKRGGMVIFYHVAKTGGTTVRSFFGDLRKKDKTYFKYSKYINSPNKTKIAGEYKDDNQTCLEPGTKKNLMEKQVQKFLEQINNVDDTVTYLWEIHGGSPGLDALAQYIDQLREASHAHNKSLFAFTLVREPLSFTKSYFKFFHINCRWGWCERNQYKTVTEETLVASAQSHPNQQCFHLKHMSAVDGMHPSFYGKCRVTKGDCDSIYDTMRNAFDWVGTIEELSMDTMPLL